MKRERNGRQEVYRELTMAGVVLCAVLGLAVELAVMFATGLQIIQVNAVVFLFLWFLCGVLVSGVLFTLAAWQDRRIHDCGTLPEAESCEGERPAAKVIYCPEFRRMAS